MTTKLKKIKLGAVNPIRYNPIGDQASTNIVQECGCLKADKNGIILNIHVQPRSSKNSFDGVHGQALKLRITAPPVDGKANAHVRDVLARLFQVPKTAVELLTGNKNRSKRFLIQGTTLKEAERILTGIL